MAFGVNRAKSAEQDRQRALSRIQAQEEVSDQTDQPQAPAASRPTGSFRPGTQNRPAGNAPARPTRRFSPGGNTRPMSREQDEARYTPSMPKAVEDGVSSVQVVRRLLEIAAVRRWPQDRVARLELMAHEDSALAWAEISGEWERLCEDRRKAAAGRNGEQISFRIISGGVARESRPTGPRARNMTLLHGMDLIRVPVDRSPFSAEIVAEVAAQQRKMRQEAAAQTAGGTTQAVSTTSEQAPAQPEQESAAPRTNRFVRTTRP